MNSKHIALSASFSILVSSAAALATELVYTPVNPTFGGNPLNGTWLLNRAQAQNDYDDPDAIDRSSFTGTTALERFSSQLESRLLSQLLTNIEAGNTGSLSTDSFLIDFVDVDGALSVQITDKLTGEISVIEVNGLNAN
ncbi:MULTISPECIES: curli assembly protein CsgF [Pseudomonas]|jgi:curli production assembly/transport component CsgF|uniref:Curli production assembly/transport component CsgF n=1 Tax=Pseudomonas marincola TaxID=437900 RepID=A0A1I7CXC1_9PSED|nr:MULTISPECIES: curli assembly protein CsgF [Pseudomonas]MAB97833.1 curli production assembly protein CsgF [Pseudomonadaceae bacterium]OEO23943.1 curli production assembly protein CsgF [Pseudomonas sp. J237]CAE6904350.1 Curli production assembly/transport component CsgF [Pseudomonas marincola]SFU04026.1 curli production assembly/transport component CsgF [Pseudomonas marincola]HCP55984.1 curli production assembly protein CsgF [Pseudomonas sp.]